MAAGSLALTLESLADPTHTATERRAFAITNGSRIHCMVHLNWYEPRGLPRQVLKLFLQFITPWAIGNSPYSMGALYKHAIALLLQMSTEQPQSPSFGLHLDQLSLTFTTTNGLPIPWDTALYFIRRMLAFLDRRFIGPEFQAFVTDLALDVTIEISLRLLLDGPLPGVAFDD
ncbi:MAG: hypothetical protein L6R35_006204 [Caloplaca aegaea]|nr:MAG: hypothetical protein L6R35_006204 [Caloplaca aegaea]